MGKNTTIAGAVLCLVAFGGLLVSGGAEPEVPTEPAPTADPAAFGGSGIAAPQATPAPPPPPAPMAESRPLQDQGPRTLVRLAVGWEAREFFDPLWEAAVEAALPHVDVMVSVAGNRDVLDQLRQERVDLAGIHGELSWREREAGLVDHPLGRERFVLVVQDTHQLWELGLEQVRSVLTGKARDWRELGGEALPLQLVVPAEQGFLARAVTAMVPGDPLAEGCVRAVDEAAVLETVRNVPGSLGLVRAPALAGATGVKAVRVEGLDLSTARMQAGSCRFGERVLLVTSGTPSPVAREVSTYLTSPAGKALLTRALVVD